MVLPVVSPLELDEEEVEVDVVPGGWVIGESPHATASQGAARPPSKTSEDFKDRICAPW